VQAPEREVLPEGRQPSPADSLVLVLPSVLVQALLVLAAMQVLAVPQVWRKIRSARQGAAFPLVGAGVGAPCLRH
jgi:hypothetical protein